MKALYEVQSHAKDLIAAHAYLTGETVVADLGLGETEREQSLNDKGLCVTVLPLDDADTNLQRQGARPNTPFTFGSGAGQGICVVEVTVFVVTLLNSARNAARGAPDAPKDIYRVLAAVSEALLGYGPVNPNDRYSVAPAAFRWFATDDGLLGYIQAFRKHCVI